MTLHLGTKSFSFFIRPDVFNKTGLISVGFCRNRHTKACMEDHITLGARSDTLAEFVANEDPTNTCSVDGKTYSAKSIGWGRDENGNPQKITYSAEEMAARAKLRAINKAEEEIRRQKLDLEINNAGTNLRDDVVVDTFSTPA